MQKIITLFQRNYDGDRLVRNEVMPGAEWVLAGEGRATRKFDGTCCCIRDGLFWKRYEVKHGAKPPLGFVPAAEVDENTGKQQGWLLVGAGPEDRWHREAWDRCPVLHDGTYELCGPKIQGNPENEPVHILLRHGSCVLEGVPRDFEGIRGYLAGKDIEGVVWWHPDGRLVKIKGRDYGLRRSGK